MAETRTKPTRASVKDFISEVESEARRKDADEQKPIAFDRRHCLMA